MSNQNSILLFLVGLVTGSLVGASLALLLAPQSGAETRSQIKNKGVELRDGAVEGLTEAGHRVQTQAHAWQEKGQEVSGAISRSKDNIVQAVTNNKDKVVDEAVG
jgi:gas vesicle protein